MSTTPASAPPPPLPGARRPGPRGHWLWGCLSRMTGDPLTFYREAWQQYGECVRIHAALGIHYFLVTHPDHVEHVLAKNHRNYRKPTRFLGPLRHLTGQGLLTAEGDLWLRQRRLAQPAFHRDHVARLAPRMVESAEVTLAEWGEAGDRTVDVAASMARLSLRVAGLTLFSADISGEADEVGSAFREALDYVGHRMNHFPWLPLWWPARRNRRFRRAKKVLDRAVLGLIARRRQAPADTHNDLLSLYLTARDEETGQGMTDRQLMDEVLTLLLAGSDTMAAALSWAWHLLGLHPEIQSAVADEVCGALAGRPPAATDLPRLPLTRAVFDEVLRLYPPAWAVPREPLADDEVGGVKLPRGTVVVLCPWVTHRRPDFWDEPEKFRPERFLGAGPSGRHRFAYYPFGGGPRMCIGASFSLLEGPLLLAALIQRFAVDPEPGHEVVADATCTLRPKNGVLARVRARGALPPLAPASGARGRG